MAARDGRIQIALGLFVPCGFRADALVENCLRIFSNQIMVLIRPLINSIYKSDASSLASTGAASDHTDRVKTQLPYAAIIGGISVIAFSLL